MATVRNPLLAVRFQAGCFSNAKQASLRLQARAGVEPARKSAVLRREIDRQHVRIATDGGSNLEPPRKPIHDVIDEHGREAEIPVHPLYPGSDDHDEVTLRPGCSIPQPQRYTTHDFFHVLRSWPGSRLLKRIAPALICFTAWAALVTVVWKIKQIQQTLPLTLHSLLGSALGLLLVYRTNSANDRFWEGRRMWERVVSASRDIVALCGAHAGHIGHERLRRIGSLLSAFSVCLTEYVVGPGRTEHILPLWRLLGDEESFVLSSGSPPCRIVQMLLMETTQIPDSRDGLFTSRERGLLNGWVAELQHAVAQGERLVQTPIPQSYVRHTSRFLTLWLATLPFGLCHLVGWWTPAVVWGFSWALIGINDLGLGIEHPFDGPQSLRMRVMCETVHAAVTDALHAVAAPRFAGLKRSFLERDMNHVAIIDPCGQVSHGGAHHTDGKCVQAAKSHHCGSPLEREVSAVDCVLGRTALHHAAYGGDASLVLRLMAAGANINAQDGWDGSTPLDVARARNHCGVVSCLSNAGAKTHVFESLMSSLPVTAPSVSSLRR
eukprot:CAMPEP_0115187976 /NCGR_PEP_ID=MMETSP0270-20121206/10770_1 /TAXON_ID=71861 /ORGANISM="Scrippsiella trochoidea, Strain CCMP3099" /LENGTH=549 /DNA_ID=CAMNT_0002601139 /DNA_START=101 /DNA_END=1750 /DNA_ORIENTATION=-